MRWRSSGSGHRQNRMAERNTGRRLSRAELQRPFSCKCFVDGDNGSSPKFADNAPRSVEPEGHPRRMATGGVTIVAWPDVGTGTIKITIAVDPSHDGPAAAVIATPILLTNNLRF